MQKEIKLYHVSNPENRLSILKDGLIPSIGFSYQCQYEDGHMGPVVFVSTDNLYDSTYDDDRYEISLSKEEYENLEFQEDLEASNALFTENLISKEKIRLIYRGSGQSNF